MFATAGLNYRCYVMVCSAVLHDVCICGAHLHDGCVGVYAAECPGAQAAHQRGQPLKYLSERPVDSVLSLCIYYDEVLHYEC